MSPEPEKKWLTLGNKFKPPHIHLMHYSTEFHGWYPVCRVIDKDRIENGYYNGGFTDNDAEVTCGHCKRGGKRLGVKISR